MIAKIALRKMLHDYAIPIFATVLLVLLFAGLWITHLYALGSVNNLARSNPLIVSDANKLTSQDETADPIAMQIDEGNALEEPSSSSSATPTNNNSQSPTGTGSQSPVKNGGSSGGGGTATPTTPQAQFAVSLGSMQHNRNSSNIVTGLFGLLLGCTIDHQFKIQVNGLNGPGTVKYRWVRSTGGGSDIEQKALAAGSSSIELAHSWTTSTTDDYWVSLEVYAPAAMEKKYSFRHQC